MPIGPYDNLDRLTTFKPVYSAQHTARMVQQYQRAPQMFNPYKVTQIANHASHHKIPFERYEVKEEDPFSVLRGIRQLAEGFMTGFSTFEVGEYSNNRWERIMRSVGEVSGFAGFIPAAPLKLAKMNKLAELAKKYRGTSVPLWVAGKATKKARNLLKPIAEKAAGNRAGAFNEAAGFLLKDVPSHVAEGAFSLGVASAVGSWQRGVDAMLHAGMHGAVTGGVFRAIGNAINAGGIPSLDRATGLYKLNPTQETDKMLRALAGSIFDGMQSTMRGETSEEQVYSYLLGAFFGGR